METPRAVVGCRLETDTAHMTLTTHLKRAPAPPYSHRPARPHRLVFDHRGTTATCPPQLTPPSEPTTKHASGAYEACSQVTLDGTVRIAEGESHHLSFQQLRADSGGWFEGPPSRARNRQPCYGGSYQGMVQMKPRRRPRPAYSWGRQKSRDMYLGEAITGLHPGEQPR